MKRASRSERLTDGCSCRSASFSTALHFRCLSTHPLPPNSSCLPLAADTSQGCKQEIIKKCTVRTCSKKTPVWLKVHCGLTCYIFQGSGRVSGCVTCCRGKRGDRLYRIQARRKTLKNPKQKEHFIYYIRYNF